METLLLREASLKPTNEVLASVLGKTYPVFDQLIQTVTSDEWQLVPVWNYYKDGKAWLCKVQYKKKTVFWLSVWDFGFKTGFYFTAKNVDGIFQLPIEEEIKKDFRNSKPIGKLIPLVLSVSKKSLLKDVLTVTRYKKTVQ